MMFEFGEYGFIKGKFENQYFRLVEILARSIENGKKKILESSDVSIAVQFLFDWSKRALDRSKGTFDWSKLEKLNFLVIVQKGWRGFKPCEWFYETF